MRNAFVLAILACLALTGVAQVAPPAEKAWPYRTPVRPPLPDVHNSGWMRNPIDAFILARLEAEGLQPSPEADRATLLRRVTFDLTGLPPTPAEVDAFLADPAPDAYEKVVDRLLDSPHHGEHWATYWLDLVRFAETDGFKADDFRPDAWRYRDYVIRSLNTDKPYDRFVKEQLAGDELFPGDLDALIATGFNRHFPDEYNAVNLEQRRQEILNDLTDTTSLVFLGLTVGCARCHDHKYDPILQEDYYRLQAWFAAYAPVDQPLAPHETVEQYRRRMAEWETKTAGLRKRMGELEEPVRHKLSDRRRFRFPQEYASLLDVPEGERTPLQCQLVEMVRKQVDIDTGEVVKAMKPEVRKEWDELSKQIAEFAPLRPSPLPKVMSLTDVGPQAPATHLLRRGEWRNPGKEVAPGFLSAIDDRPAEARPVAGGTTGRRAALAEWLTRAEHPLTARVMVNRLWQHHFGRGIVGTPSDYGAQGEPPTHPELLDWLAAEFVARGWSMKQMHRVMVTSATYRQASSAKPQAVGRDPRGIDPENRLLWRMNRRRLEGEAARDAILAVSGRLSLKAGGPSIYPELPPELGKKGNWPVSADAGERDRLSVYVCVKRNLRYPFFGTFDSPDRTETCSRRFVTTTAPQALALLNGRMTLEQARFFAGRVLREVGANPMKVIDEVYRLALGRKPAADERDMLRSFLRNQSEELRPRLAGKTPPPIPTPAPADLDAAYGAAVVDLCHALFNLNEFLYVD